MVSRSKLFLFFLILFLTPFQACYSQSPAPNQTESDRVISDEELIAYARSSFDKAKMMHKTIILGRHQGQPVKVSFPCGDICPSYTKRIIFYDVELENCEKAGGVKKEVHVPRSITMMIETYCLPKVLVDQGNQMVCATRNIGNILNREHG